MARKKRRHTVLWKRKEIKFILEGYHLHSARELAEKLPGRTMKSVLRKLEELRKKGLLSPMTDADVKKRKQLRRKVDDTDILDEGYDGANGGFVYEEI